MLFNSYSFLLFFPIVVGIYLVIPKKLRYLWLLVASYYFYMSWNIKYVVLLVAATGITWLSGILLEKSGSDRTKKAVVAVSLISNLAILGFFKYFDFGISTINRVLGFVGINAINNPFDFLLPVGISFYTFQALSYTIDVYRGDVDAERNLLKYALYVSFFPQLVAGPIERSKNLLNQLREIEKINVWNYERVANGLMIMVWGYFQKMVIADRAAILVDKVYASWYQYGSVELIIASVLFAIQIYCDFSGYTLIAIGAAKVMGFSLMENFNTPYLSSSIKDFWRRWHISMSSWFRDYVYIPLGGSRCSKIKTYRNILITFLVSGLWHGANWTFVVWGGLHGVYQIIGDIFNPLRKKVQELFNVSEETFSFKFGRVIGTFVLVDFAWIFFRAQSLADACGIIKRIFVNVDPWVLHDGDTIYSLGLAMNEIHILAFALVILAFVDFVKYLKAFNFDTFLNEQGFVFRWITLVLLIASVFVYGIYGIGYEDISFLYFQF